MKKNMKRAYILNLEGQVLRFACTYGGWLLASRIYMDVYGEGKTTILKVIKVKEEVKLLGE